MMLRYKLNLFELTIKYCYTRTQASFIYTSWKIKDVTQVASWSFLSTQREEMKFFFARIFSSSVDYTHIYEIKEHKLFYQAYHHFTHSSASKDPFSFVNIYY